MPRRHRRMLRHSTQTLVGTLVVLGSLLGTPYGLWAQGTSCSTAEDIRLTTTGIVTSVRTLVAGARQFFRITTPSRGILTVSTEGTTNTFGILYGPDGIEIERNDAVPGNDNFRISRQLATGIYCVEVLGGGGGVALAPTG